MLTLVFLSLQMTFAAGLSPLLDLGDQAWCEEDYSLAKASWKEAAESEHPAVRAMAEFRLLQTASNLGWTIHGARGDSALSLCSPYDPWCGIAWVDRELILERIGIPANLEIAERQLNLIESELPGPTVARHVWMNNRPPSDLNGLELDGLGECLVKSQWPKDNPKPFIGFGLTGGGMLGIGGAITVAYPLSHTKGLQTSLSYTTQKAGHLSLVAYAGEQWGARSELQLSNRPYFLYSAPNVFSTEMISYAQISAGPTFRLHKLYTSVGLNLRSDTPSNSNWQMGHGPIVQVHWLPHKQVRVYYSSESTWFDYIYLRNDLDFKWVHPVGAAFQASIHTALGQDAPWWRLPTAGGGVLMRTPQAQQIRANIIPFAVAEWRFRQEKTLGLVTFLEGTFVESPHWGVGTGVRFRLPPKPHNTTRIDIGYGDYGWGLSVGMGEFF